MLGGDDGSSNPSTSEEPQFGNHWSSQSFWLFKDGSPSVVFRIALNCVSGYDTS